MLSEEGGKNLFKHISELYIEPEIERRKQAGILPANFKISRCLIKLPKDKKPIIEFNNEVQWIAHVQFEQNTTLSKGQEIYLHQIKKIWSVSLPEINSERIAFIYFFFDGIGYQIAFDFTPNFPEEMLSKEEKARSTLSLSEQIGKSLQAALEEKTIRIHDKERLQEIGLWVAPGLLAYPLSKIIKQLGENDLQGARNTLVEYCTPQYLERISSKWWSVEEFNCRKKLLLDAVVTHGNYEEELFSEENSIKSFLLLDTIHHIISTQSAIENAGRGIGVSS